MGEARKRVQADDDSGLEASPRGKVLSLVAQSKRVHRALDAARPDSHFDQNIAYVEASRYYELIDQVGELVRRARLVEEVV